MGKGPEEKCRLNSNSQYSDLSFIVYSFVRININIL